MDKPPRRSFTFEVSFPPEYLARLDRRCAARGTRRSETLRGYMDEADWRGSNKVQLIQGHAAAIRGLVIQLRRRAGNDSILLQIADDFETAGIKIGELAGA